MAEGLIGETGDAVRFHQAGTSVFTRLSDAIGLYLDVPPVPRDLPGWKDLDQPGREMFAGRFDEWASLFGLADVAVRAAAALELPSAEALDMWVEEYHLSGPIYGPARTWTMGAYAQIAALESEPRERIRLFRTQAGNVADFDWDGEAKAWWRWQGGRLLKQHIRKDKQTKLTGEALTDQWWDWNRDVGDFQLEPSDTMRLHERNMMQLRRVQEVLTGVDAFPAG